MSEELDVVNEDLTNPTETESEEVEESIKEDEVLEEASPAPGSKTDPALLLQSLKEEREKRREAERKAKELEEQISSSPQDNEVYSDEGKLLQKRIVELEKELKNSLSTIKEDTSKKEVLASYPILKDKWAEFEEFRSDPEYDGLNVKAVAKVFLAENGLFSKPRKGLEKPTGGDKTPKPVGMTPEEKENLRKTDYKRYKKLLIEGKI